MKDGQIKLRQQQTKGKPKVWPSFAPSAAEFSAFKETVLGEQEHNVASAAAEYVELCMKDPPAADRMLSKLPKHSRTGLPGVVRDPTNERHILEFQSV